MAQVRIEPLTEEELDRYFKTVNGCGNDMYVALVHFFFNTGCRIYETHSLLIRSIDYDKREIHIPMTKKDKTRDVFIDDRTANLLKQYIETNKIDIESREKEFERLVDKRKKELDELITGKNKAREVRKQLRAYIRTLRSPVWGVSYRQIHRIISNLGKKAGISKSIHSPVLRYAYAQTLSDSDSNADIVSIQYLMGHSNISTTRGYIFYNKSKARDMYDRAMDKKKEV